MRRAWVLIAATVLVTSGCIGAGGSGPLDQANADEDQDPATTNVSEHELDQEAELSFTHVAYPTGRHHSGANCLMYDKQPTAENLTGTIEVTWTPTTPAFERLQVRMASGFDILGETQGTSPLNLSIQNTTPTGDDLKVFVETPRDPAGVAVEQEATIALDLAYEADESFEFETGWGCAFVSG